MSAKGGHAFSLMQRFFRRVTGLCLVVSLCLVGLLSPDFALAQDPSGGSSGPAVDSTGALVPNSGGRGPSGSGGAKPGAARSSSSGLNYDEWQAMAGRADALLADGRAGGDDLDRMRALLVDWREALLGAQSANSTRIAVIRSQIAALGPVPEDGAAEAAEIARRRAELNDQLVRLQAPGIKADEAYEQADGLILQIDRLRRDRQAEELLRLWPSPVNPANWPSALSGLSKTAVTLWGETSTRMANETARKTFLNNLPLILLLFVFSFAILWRGRRWLDLIVQALPLPVDARAARLSLFLAQLGQVIVPVSACVALTIALRSTDLDFANTVAPALPAASADVGRLTVRALPSVTAVARSDWDRLFPGIAEGWDYFRACEQSAPEGFTSSAIGAFAGETLVAAAPLFRLNYRLDMPQPNTVTPQ